MESRTKIFGHAIHPILIVDPLLLLSVTHSAKETKRMTDAESY